MIMIVWMSVRFGIVVRHRGPRIARGLAQGAEKPIARTKKGRAFDLPAGARPLKDRPVAREAREAVSGARGAARNAQGLDD
jgi:hypothetical protein